MLMQSWPSLIQAKANQNLNIVEEVSLCHYPLRYICSTFYNCVTATHIGYCMTALYFLSAWGRSWLPFQSNVPKKLVFEPLLSIPRRPFIRLSHIHDDRLSIYPGNTAVSKIFVNPHLWFFWNLIYIEEDVVGNLEKIMATWLGIRIIRLYGGLESVLLDEFLESFESE